MCGACGSGSARSASRHWSTPWLGSVPSRTAVARNLTAWARSAGSTLTVTGVASGFQVATASGRRQLAGDVGEVVDQLQGPGLTRRRLLEGSVLGGLVEGPATPPAKRVRRRPDRSVFSAARPSGTVQVESLPADPRRPYRVPALLAWLALADGAGVLGSLRVQLDLGAGTGIELSINDGAVLGCEARRASGRDLVVTEADSQVSSALLALLR